MSEWDSSTGYLLGGHVVRFFHGHDECLTIPSTDQNDSQQKWVVMHFYTLSSQKKKKSVDCWLAVEFEIRWVK